MDYFIYPDQDPKHCKTTIKRIANINTIEQDFEQSILALVIPLVIVIVFGIIIFWKPALPSDFSNLLLLFALFILSGAVLFLVKKLQRFFPV